MKDLSTFLKESLQINEAKYDLTCRTIDNDFKRKYVPGSRLHDAANAGNFYNDLAIFKITSGNTVEYTGMIKSKTSKCEVPDVVNFENKKYTVTSIGGGAIKAAGIKQVILPNTIIKINDNAFCLCEDLQLVNFPENVEYIGSNAFYRGKRSKGILKFTNDLPDTVKYIGENAFAESKILNVKLPNIEQLEFGAFQSCGYLKSIELGDKLQSIKPYTFYSCTQLEKAEFGNGLKSIENNAFAGCKKLKTDNFVLPDNFQKLSKSAIYKTSINTDKLQKKYPDLKIE